MSKNCYMRTDTVRITINGQLWASIDGGARFFDGRALGYRRLYLSRPRCDENCADLVSLMNSNQCRAEIAHLDSNGAPTGVGYIYTCHVVEVQPSPFDANKADTAIDKLILQPFYIEVL